MTLAMQMDFFEHFYHNGPLGAMRSRERDYAPDGVVLLNILDTCVRSNISPAQAVGVLLDKQLTALDHFRKHGHTKSETVTSRCADACNYLAFFAMLDQCYPQIWAGWWNHWRMNVCVGGTGVVSGSSACCDSLSCARCEAMRWLTSHAPRA